MLRAATELVRHAVGFVYPNACLICDAGEDSGSPFRHGLCPSCHAAVGTDPFPACPWCAQTVGPHTDTSNGCGECRGQGFDFDGVVRLGRYTGKLRDAILRMKVRCGEGLADFMGRVFAEARGAALVGAGIDLVVPVPLHPLRKWLRGYNQSEAVARELAATLSVPFDPLALRRVRFATQHAQPTRAARQANIADAFRVRRGARLSGKTVLLVDDVLTTGSTASAAAGCLRAAGTRRVLVATLARK